MTYWDYLNEVIAFLETYQDQVTDEQRTRLEAVSGRIKA
jgi:hypothetical protein